MKTVSEVLPVLGGGFGIFLLLAALSGGLLKVVISTYVLLATHSILLILMFPLIIRALFILKHPSLDFQVIMILIAVINSSLIFVITITSSSVPVLLRLLAILEFIPVLLILFYHSQNFMMKREFSLSL